MGLASKTEIGAAIKDARKRYRYTQKQLAEKIALSQSFIGDIESGRTYPSLATLASIAETLELDPAELIKNGSPTKVSYCDGCGALRYCPVCGRRIKKGDDQS